MNKVKAKAAALLAALAISVAGCSGCKGDGDKKPPAPAPVKKQLSGPAIKPTTVKENPVGDASESINKELAKVGGKAAPLSVAALTAPGASDEVWGGVYAGPGVHVKTLWHNAAAMKLLLEEYRKTGDEKFLDAAKSIHGYIAEFLTAPEGNSFYAAQAGEVKGKSGDEYFKLDRAGREALGIPARDKKSETHHESVAVSAYLSLYEVLGWDSALETAVKVVDRLSATLAKGKDNICVGASVSSCNPVFSALISELLDAYQDTGRNLYLDRAKELANGYMIRHESPIVFWPGSDNLYDRMAFSNILSLPVSLKRLSYYTGDESYGKDAEILMADIRKRATGDKVLTEYEKAYIDKAESFVKAHPLQMVVLGPEGDPATTKMLQAALKFYHPLKVVYALDPNEAADKARLSKLPYTPKEKPTLFACVATACAMPVSDPAQVDKRMKAFTDRFLPRDGQQGRLILQNAR